MTARKSTGGVVEKVTTRGTSYGVRFRALGRRQFVHVGYAADGVTRADAERELTYALEQVRRGEWLPPSQVPAPREVPTFQIAASDWLDMKLREGGQNGRGMSPSGAADLRWRLDHLLPTFGRTPVDQITVEEVDRYRAAKVRHGGLAPSSVNKTIAALSAVLELHVEYGHLARNPAAGRRRRVPAGKPRRTYLERAEHIEALLQAAGELDRESRSDTSRRALLATLVFAGPRIDEALSLRWRSVDLAEGRLRIEGTKTTAAARIVRMLPVLRDELAGHAARASDRSPGALVFPTDRGTKRSASNVRRRALAPAVERANDYLAARGADSLPPGLTPHSLRRTFASLLVALGTDMALAMRQMGHTTPHLTLSVYAQAMDWTDGERERLRALADGHDWAPTGTSAETALRDELQQRTA